MSSAGTPGTPKNFLGVPGLIQKKVKFFNLLGVMEPSEALEPSNCMMSDLHGLYGIAAALEMSAPGWSMASLAIGFAPENCC
jgi:hypothetical protein